MNLLDLFFATSESRYGDWLERSEQRQYWLAGVEDEARRARLKRRTKATDHGSKASANFADV